ncbi:helix-turn-helix transcriptional regulator [Desertifilum sp. FACHB-1129]|uniref:HTH araC/xylS-type domain-containing protein n=2 Tax=Desertifilum tharense IPPAS B-1220 TaxID=1781255 RepID=A0A1E5QKI3_9CYAN|nr:MULTISPECIES: AraC family transcriptional regulator [Desertifilum]MDA0211090.1 AraC family transcriptional regulator [Cyanobacteria bacterium FC1]MBD2314174.1 helix-turn-helix transcriptional regulator [Desertifilum sp. FACHB-1129]MBD2320139.1 helix-turn-helix transcriptional regulator [Desertifilum sp. FACHB-866]MBD2330267.1 helix-turn-helix transcriptional regulator [Desertifilum sp. FACHB-868]OEJ75101.1 hypothetical protein BH720_10240 [Desertifilum tharense IPPAS B-1220]
MRMNLTGQNCNDLWEESQQNGSLVSYNDSSTIGWQGYVPHLGKVQEWIVSLKEGLKLRFYEYVPQSNLQLSEHYGEGNWSTLSFFIVGDVSTTIKGVIDRVDERSGRTYLSSSPDTLEIEDWPAGEQLTRLQVAFAPSYFLNNFTQEQIASLPLEVRQAIEGKIEPYYYPGSITPAMRTAIHQILHCPYHGAMKQLYLEGKALELMTLQFGQFERSLSHRREGVSLKTDDIDRIHQAKDILIQNIANPPSLLELARQVAVNDCKLKQGFRQVFGTTVFGYLLDYRLEQARHLLESSNLSVAEVARQIGLSDRSYFAATFRKKFGLNPSEYARQHRVTLAAFSNITCCS